MKVFEDRIDNDSMNNIMPMFKKQESLILNRTIAQSSDERSATIYSGGVNTGNSDANWQNFLNGNVYI